MMWQAIATSRLALNLDREAQVIPDPAAQMCYGRTRVLAATQSLTQEEVRAPLERAFYDNLPAQPGCVGCGRVKNAHCKQVYTVKHEGYCTNISRIVSE